MRKKIYNKFFITLPFIVLLYAGCDALGVFAGSSSAEFSLITELAGVNTVYIPNDKFFYVNLKPGTFEGEENNRLDALIYAMDDGPGKDCKIPVEEESTEDLYCLIDIMEGDLWIHTFNIEYNVPAGMCDFLDFQVPWHFNQKVGKGPDDIYQCDDYQVGICESEEDDEGNITGYTVETETRYCLGGCVKGACGTGEEAQEVTTGCKGIPAPDENDPNNFRGGRDEIQTFCNGLDLSDVDLGNCCFGTYDLHSSEGGEPTTARWGGNLESCIGGFGRINWNTRGKYGEPISLVEPTKRNGLRKDYKIHNLVNLYKGHRETKGLPGGVIVEGLLQGHRPSLINANYFVDIEDKNFLGDGPRVYKTPTKCQLPGGCSTYLNVYNYQQTGYPYFTWACLNQAYEIKHRIHVAIREWNTQEEFNAFVESKGGRGDPDLEGSEGSVCEYYEATEKDLVKDTACNDMWDLDNLEDQKTGASTTHYYNPYPEILYGGN